MTNVLDMSEHRPPFDPPRHFKKLQRAVWAELVERTVPALHVPAYWFTFEIAATLLQRFRCGRQLGATEVKELRRLMESLGLALDGAAAAERRKGSKVAKYFGGGDR